MPLISLGLIWRFASAAIIGLVPYGLIYATVTVELARNGTPAMVIGLFAALPFLLLFVGMPFLPTVQARMGRARSFKLGLSLGALAALGFAVNHELWWWMGCSALVGLAAMLQWGLAETQIAENAPRGSVGRLTGLYQTFVALGLVLGPLLPGLMGWSAANALWAATALAVLAFVPILGVADHRIDLVADRAAPVSSFHGARSLLGLAPALFVVALAGGLFETGLNAMIAVEALGLGATRETAQALIAVIATGSLGVQYPLGRLADKVSVDRLFMTCALLLLASAAVLPAALWQPLWLWPLAAVWGAVGGGLYTLAMTHVGQRFRDGRAAMATSLVITAYTLGSLGGPLAGGALHDLAPIWGLALLLGLTALAMVIMVRLAPLCPQPRGKVGPFAIA